MIFHASVPYERRSEVDESPIQSKSGVSSANTPSIKVERATSPISIAAETRPTVSRDPIVDSTKLVLMLTER